jgi:hypothetical protein
MIKTVATTFADAVRLAQKNGNADYWTNTLEAGPLQDATVKNRLASGLRESIRDQNLMALCTKYGRRWQVTP